MSKWMLAAGAAAMALAVPSLAQKGGDKGGGPKGGGNVAKVERGGGGGGAPKAAEQRQPVARGDGPRAERQPARQAVRVDQRNDRPQRAERREARAEQREFKAASPGNRAARSDARLIGDERRIARADDGRVRGLADGCPPGLARKGNGCLPPGQAKKLIGAALPASLAAAALSGPFSQWYRDDERFFYRNDGD